MDPAFRVLGWPPDGPQLRLDYRRFRYAGKFVMSNTGKAVACDPDATREGEYDAALAAVAFNEDRTDPATWWLRYITVRDDLRGEGLGARLAAFAADRIESRGGDRIRIAVNNPFAYQALYKAGFGFTGEETGIAELVLERPDPRDTEAYQSGLDRYRTRDPGDPEATFLDDKRGASPPGRVDAGP
ncbi:GNAT family N-acetyltransferase [Salinirarus marinus]|uniref:GNAT family N-acetyltransferase n=1 Tax=Salinirarus marinus TaxID=3068310 RepID=UPI003C6C506F